MVGLFTGNPDSLRAGLRDVLVEPRRAHLIPGLREREEGGARRGRPRRVDLGRRAECFRLV